MSSSSDDVFAFFFSGDPPDMCPAADVISAGKLLPFVTPTSPTATPPTVGTHLPRRSGAGQSFNKDCQKLARNPEAAPPPPATMRRPRWYVFVFGSLKVPAGMEMSDIRTRQRRRIGKQPATAGWGGGGGPWKLLQSLSCKGMESAVATTAPLSFVLRAPARGKMGKCEEIC